MQPIPLTRNFKGNEGFTLIEVMIAILILMVGMLGLLQSVNVVIEYNLKNHLRDEAVAVGEKYMQEFKGENFDTMIVGDYAPFQVNSKLRGGARKYTIEKSTLTLATDVATSKITSRRLQVVVKWLYRDQEFRNTVNSVVSKPA